MKSLPVLLLLLATGCAWARPGIDAPPDEGVKAESVTYRDRTYEVVRVDLSRAQLRLFWRDSNGERYRTFERLEASLASGGQRLLFATNAGIFDPEFAPLGLHVENGRQKVPLNRDNGEGNFYLKPNGVFYVSEDKAAVVNAQAFDKPTESLTLATQSGPLLLENGRIHPAFKEDSKHRKTRSAVGIKTPAEVVFVLSLDPVTFHELATLYRDQLSCNDALYLDGEISEFHLPGKEMGSPLEEDFAGMIGVVSNQFPIQKPTASRTDD